MWRRKSENARKSCASPPLRHIFFLATYPVRLEARHLAGPFRLDLPRRLISALAAHSVPGLSYPVLWSGGEPTGPWLSTVYHARACKRYYGLMRQSDGLRPAWL